MVEIGSASFSDFCPHIDVLRQFAQGRIDDDSKVIENHLSSCSRCSAALDEVESEHDSLVLTLRHRHEDSAESQIACDRSSTAESQFAPEERGLEGRYRVIELIARGGMGLVYRALDRVFGREVAVKVIHPKYRSDAETAQRFSKEAALTARLQHPGIPAMHDLAKSVAGEPFLVMKLVSGRTLAALLKERTNPSQDIQKFLSVLEQVARAVGYAHAQGVIHRDLKPANIMVGAFGEVQVMDWGLAKELQQKNSAPDDHARKKDQDDSQTLHGTVLGTPAYMPPEQARGEISSVDARADVFALGAILFEILTGRSLYSDAEQSLLECAQNRDKSASFEQLFAAGIDDDLALITKQCLAADIACRPTNGDAVADLVANHRTLTDQRLQMSERNRAAADVRSREVAKRQHVALLGVIAFSTALAIGAGFSITFAFQAQAEAKKSEHAAAEMEKEAEKARSAEEEQKKAAIQAMNAAEREKKAADLAEKRLNEVEKRLSLAKIARVVNQMSLGNSGFSLAVLDSIPERHRGWEHSWLTRQVAETPFVLYGHSNSVTAISVRPDGAQLASCSYDKTIKLWDTRSGAELHTLEGHNDAVSAVTFSPNGKIVASGANDGTVKFWEAETGKEVATFAEHSKAIISLAFDVEGARLASASGDGTLKVWDVSTLKELLTIREYWPGFGRVGFSADGSQLVSSFPDGRTKLWNSKTGVLESGFQGVYKAYGSPALSPDQLQIAVCTDGAVRILDVRTGTERLFLHVAEHGPIAVAFSPDGAQLASSAGGITKLWDVYSGKELASFNGASASIAFGPDGTWLACGTGSQIKIWSTRVRKELLAPFHQDSVVSSVAFSSDGKQIISGSNNSTVKVWDVTTGANLRSLNVGYAGNSFFDRSALAIAPGAGQVARAVGLNELSLWDVEAWKEVRRYKDENIRTSNPYDGGIFNLQSAVFSPDGLRVACGTFYGSVTIWDARSGEKLVSFSPYQKDVDEPQRVGDAFVPFKPERTMKALAFNRDGTQLVTCSDSNLRLWDVKTGTELASLAGHTAFIWSASFSPDGTLLVSGAMDGTIKVWNAKTGDELETVLAHTAGVMAIAFNSEGSKFATGSFDGSITIWDTQMSVDVITLRGHEGGVTSVAFSPDNSRLVTGSHDKTIRIWDTRAGTECLNLRGHKGRVAEAYLSTDGKQLVVTNELKEVTRWNAYTGEPEQAEVVLEGQIKRKVSPDGRAHVVELPHQPGQKKLVRTTDLWIEEYDRRQYWVPIWHEQEAQRSEDEKSWFAAAWHLKRLDALKPSLTPELQRVIKGRFTASEKFHGNVVDRLKHAEIELAKRIEAK